jgi:toxin ParE1/3/4
VTRVRWTPQARDDLRRIHEYISRDSPHYAALVIAELLASVRRLQSFPQSGRIVPERSEPTLREVIWRNYRVVYRHLDGANEVHVVLVFRAERLFPTSGA